MDSDRRRFGLAVALVLLASLAVPSAALGQNPPEPQVISALGVAQVAGRTTFVDVWVVVPAGADPQAAARDALERLGARPFNPAALGSTGFTLDGLVWPNNGASLTSAVTQNYNPANDPFVSAANPSGAQGDLTASEAAWGNVSMTVSGSYNNPTSFFSMGFGGTTNRCPSLVAECPGAQFLDGFEDVGWLQLQPGVLGVTWFTTSPPEADMALSTAFTWNTGCTNISGSFDVQTVFLHENGHLVGLGHSKD